MRQLISQSWRSLHGAVAKPDHPADPPILLDYNSVYAEIISTAVSFLFKSVFPTRLLEMVILFEMAILLIL